MGMKIYGILAAQNKDNAGEIINIEGMDTSKLGPLVDEHHEEPTFFDHLGAITFHKKILNPQDCENERQKQCWERAKAPLLYIEGELADDEDHPNAKAAAALIKFCAKPNIPLKPGLSVDGGVLSRLNGNGQQDENGHYLDKTMALRGSLTVKPCNPVCFLSPMNNLTKSDLAIPPPDRYWQDLKKAAAKTSFLNTVEAADLHLYLGLSKLKKSLTDYFGGFTSIRCKKCGSGIRFFKSSSDLPNGCSKCSEHFSMNDIWQSLNK